MNPNEIGSHLDPQSLARTWRDMRSESAQAIDISRLPERVQARLKTAFDGANERAARAHRASQGTKAAMDVMLRRAVEPRIGQSERVQRFWRLADAWNQSFDTVSACERGCNHCCHQSVAIPLTEAVAIAAATGKTLDASPENGIVPATSIAGLERIQQAHKGHACPMLIDGECSIYAKRPMACRLLINLDDDGLLCEIIPNESVPVPYADGTQIELAFAMHTGHELWKDIRDWFPEDSAKATKPNEANPAAPG